MPTGTPASQNRQIYSVAGGTLEVKLVTHRGVSPAELEAFMAVVRSCSVYAEQFPPEDPQEWADRVAQDRPAREGAR